MEPNNTPVDDDDVVVIWLPINGREPKPLLVEVDDDGNQVGLLRFYELPDAKDARNTTG